MGILSNEIKSEFVSKLDDLIKLNGILELVDGIIIKILINMLDDKVLSKVNPEFQDEIIEAFEKFNNDELDEIPDILEDILAGEISTPIINGEQVEKIIYEELLTMIVNLMEVYIVKFNN